MKFIGQSLILIFVVAVLTGCIYLLVTRSPSESAGTDIGGEFGSRRTHGHRWEGSRTPENAGELYSPERRHGERISVGRGIMGIFRTLSIIAIMTWIITRITNLRRSAKAGSPFQSRT